MYGTLLLLPPEDAFKYFDIDREQIHISGYLFITDIIYIIIITALKIETKINYKIRHKNCISFFK